MKKLLISLLICLCLISGVTALADGYYIFDGAGLLDPSDAEFLESYASETADQYDCGIYIVTVDDYLDISTDGVYEAATKIYTDRDFGVGEEKNGVMLLLSMADRDYSFIVYGDTAGYVFDDYTREYVCESFLDDFAINDWYSGFYDLISVCEGRLGGDDFGYYGDDFEYYYDSEDYIYDYQPGHARRFDGARILASAGVSAVIALIVCLILKGKLKSVRPGRDADAYAVNGSFGLSGQRDVYTHTTVTRVRHDRDSNNNHNFGGGASFGGTHSHGGGFSGTSGKF